jgi:L-serine dehydratase
MKTLKELYRIGVGPSSSHTMAPREAALRFSGRYPDAACYRISLYGSLAATGKGHLTDVAIHEAIPVTPVEILWKPGEELPLHTNGMRFEALDAGGDCIGSMEDYSIGGGALLSDHSETKESYPEKNMAEVLALCERDGLSFWEYVQLREGEQILDHFSKVWKTMQESIERGIACDGVLPGELKLPRKAQSLHRKSQMLASTLQEHALLSSYAYAVSEENASGGIIATAPTCGGSGSVPAVLYFLKNKLGASDAEVLRAIATAGLFGNLVKTNASISGAYVGCQGEVGVGCAMAAAASAQLLGAAPRQIEYAAEMGLEHHLGLTCDPVLGLVQIPCIERNAHAALRAVDCAHFGILSDGAHTISFDNVVEVMLETGKSLHTDFKETSSGGLAKIYEKRYRGECPKKNQD